MLEEGYVLAVGYFILFQSQFLTKDGGSILRSSNSDILYPPLPDAKAVPAGLTLEGIHFDETQEPFPEPSTDTLCPCIPTVRTWRLFHRCTSDKGLEVEEQKNRLIHALYTVIE